MTSTPMAFVMITLLVATWWVVHKLAHVFVAEFGLTAGLIAFIAIVAASFLDRL